MISSHLNRIAQTEAIVAQVEREVAKRAQRERDKSPLVLLAPANTSIDSLTRRTATRVVASLFPAGL